MAASTVIFALDLVYVAFGALDLTAIGKESQNICRGVIVRIAHGISGGINCWLW